MSTSNDPNTAASTMNKMTKRTKILDTIISKHVTNEGKRIPELNQHVTKYSLSPSYAGVSGSIIQRLISG